MIKRIAPFAVTLLIAACAGYPAGPSATAQLAPTKGNVASGTVTFTQQGDAVLVAGEVRGLAPGKEHGFHVHEKGDCSSGDGMVRVATSTHAPMARMTIANTTRATC